MPHIYNCMVVLISRLISARQIHIVGNPTARLGDHYSLPANSHSSFIPILIYKTGFILLS